MKKKSKTICILLGIAVMCILLCLLVAKLYKKQVNTVDFIQPDHVREEYLVIEGLEKEYELLFLTDTHVIVQSEEDDAQITANAELRFPIFADAAGVSSAEQFPYWMEYANEREVDAVLFGGCVHCNHFSIQNSNALYFTKCQFSHFIISISHNEVSTRKTTDKVFYLLCQIRRCMNNCYDFFFHIFVDYKFVFHCLKSLLFFHLSEETVHCSCRCKSTVQKNWQYMRNCSFEISGK